MLRTRVMPVLLVDNRQLVKTRKFSSPRYIGDPINTIKIFNDKEVDEVIVLDIGASKAKKEPDYDYLDKLASQCFMPLSYGGGIYTAEQAYKLLNSGIEKIILNKAAVEAPHLITEIAAKVGSQSVVVSIDIKENWFGRQRVCTLGGRHATTLVPAEWAQKVVALGAGEIFLNSIDRDGTRRGYDLNLIKAVATSVSVPLVVCGGANSLMDFRQAVNSGATAVAAGSLFVFKGPLDAVLITYPSQSELLQTFGD